MAAHDVLIIGSGLSALTAARALKTYKPVLLEARTRVGGRALTWTEGLEQPVDAGCSMVHGYAEGNPLRGILREYGIDAHIVKGAGAQVVGANGALSPEAGGALLGASAQTAYTPTIPAPPPTTSLASVLLPPLDSPELIALARTTEIGAGVKLEDIAARWWGFGQGHGGTDAFPVGGYQKVLNKLTAEVKEAGGEIELDQEVVSIEDLGSAAGVKVTTKQGQSYVAKTVISTIPLGVLKASPPTFSPPLPAPLLAAIERTRVGVLEKVVLAYDKSWWPEPNKYGAFLLLPTASDDKAPTTFAELFAQTTLNVSSFARIGHTPHPTLLTYLGANAGKFISKFKPEEVAAALHSYLVERIAPGVDVPQPKTTLVSNWLNDPFSRGATSSPITLDQSADGERASPLDFLLLGRSLWGGRLSFAGEHTELDTRGSAGGAVVSGQRVARTVQELLEREV